MDCDLCVVAAICICAHEVRVSVLLMTPELVSLHRHNQELGQGKMKLTHFSNAALKPY